MRIIQEASGKDIGYKDSVDLSYEKEVERKKRKSMWFWSIIGAIILLYGCSVRRPTDKPIRPENDWLLKSIDGVFMGVGWPYKSLSLYALKSHESFTYVSPDVFPLSSKPLTVNTLQVIVRVSFSAPNASRNAGRFCLGSLGYGACGALIYNLLIITYLQNTRPQTLCIVLRIVYKTSSISFILQF